MEEIRISDLSAVPGPSHSGGVENGRRNTNEERTPVDQMSTREHLEEQTAILRGIQDVVGGFMNDLSSGKLNPMQMLMGVMKR